MCLCGGYGICFSVRDVMNMTTYQNRYNTDTYTINTAYNCFVWTYGKPFATNPDYRSFHTLWRPNLHLLKANFMWSVMFYTDSPTMLLHLSQIPEDRFGNKQGSILQIMWNEIHSDMLTLSRRLTWKQTFEPRGILFTKTSNCWQNTLLATIH